MSRLLLALFALSFARPAIATEQSRSALALFGEPKYAAGFTHFDYADPKAHKGGRLTLCRVGSFDGLNPFATRAQEAYGLQLLVFERLMTMSIDEPFTMYGWLAKSVTLSDDRKEITFDLQESARFSDGKPVTAEDVLFSWRVLRDKGRPNMRAAYSQVEAAKANNDKQIEFRLKEGAAWELPLILGWLPIIPSHYYDEATFEEAGLKMPLGSGPYTVANVKPGSRIEYRRNETHWGANLPINRGRFNFDAIVVEYSRSKDTAFNDFTSGHCDLFEETDPAKWHSAYDFPAVSQGMVVRQEFERRIPTGMSALVFNTRRAHFSDIRVRKALNILFDAEFINKSLYAGLYRRTQSFFDGSELSSVGHAPAQRELELLAPFAGELDPEVLAGRARQPVADGSGQDRRSWRRALELLRQAGYELRDGKLLVNTATMQPLQFSFASANREQDRLFGVFKETTLDRIGVKADIRSYEPITYQRLRADFDFDVIQFYWSASASPGNEQLSRWTIASAEHKGSFNIAGVRSPAADAMLKAMLAARTREDFVAAVRALDRVLLSGYYVIPLFHGPKQWVAHWKRVRYPSRTSDHGYQIDTWWAESAN